MVFDRGKFVDVDGQVYFLRSQGGEGSGNFGHAGIPGQVGGSAPGGSGELKPPTEKDYDQEKAVKGITKVMGYDSEMIDLSQLYLNTFKVDTSAEKMISARDGFYKDIRTSKKDPEKLVSKLKDIVTSSSNKIEDRAVANHFTYMYANRRGVAQQYNVSTKDIIKGSVPTDVFNAFYK